MFSFLNQDGMFTVLAISRGGGEGVTCDVKNDSFASRAIIDTLPYSR